MAQGCAKSVYAGTKLDATQLASYAYNAGFRGDALTAIVAIAERESSGYTQAQCYNYDGSVDNGVLQFNSQQPPVNITPTQAQDPQTAFNAAFAAVYGTGKGFTPWAVNLFPTEPGITGALSGNPNNIFNTQEGNAANNPTYPCHGTQLFNFLGSQGICLPSNIWQRVGFGSLGFGLILIGAIALVFSPEISTGLDLQSLLKQNPQYETQSNSFIHRDDEGREYAREKATRRVRV